jgi:hypothetical protein
MRPISPRLAGSSCTPGTPGTPAAPRRPRAAVRRGAVVLQALALSAGLTAGLASACRGEPPPVAPGEPVPAPTEVALGTMDAECEALLTALGLYKQCPNLDEDDRADIDAWSERAREDFAAGKKAHPEPNAQRAIAAACHTAAGSVAAANARCHAGPRPKD